MFSIEKLAFRVPHSNEWSSFIYNSYQEPTLPRSKQEFPQPLNTWHLNSLTAFLSSVDQ